MVVQQVKSTVYHLSFHCRPQYTILLYCLKHVAESPILDKVSRAHEPCQGYSIPITITSSILVLQFILFPKLAWDIHKEWDF